MKANETSSEGKTFFSDIADQLESAASSLDSGSASTIGGACAAKRTNYLNTNFASKLMYTACYTLSYGVCFPVFVACHYIPKNNRFVEGLLDGQASANQAVDSMLERAKANRLSRQQTAEQNSEMNDVVDEGVGVLEPA